MSNLHPIGLTPLFRLEQIYNDAKSEKEKRPIFDDMEVCEIRFAGDNQKVSVFPAHADAGLYDIGNGYEEHITYAQRFQPQYRQFKEAAVQTMSGTPLDRMPFLTPARRSELKALNINTIEQLATLDDRAIKMLGNGGRDLKDHASRFLGNGGQDAEKERLEAENDAMRRELDALRKPERIKDDPKAFDTPPDTDTSSSYDDMTVDELKDLIEVKSGAKPRGNPNKATLVKMAEDISKPGEDVR